MQYYRLNYITAINDLGFRTGGQASNYIEALVETVNFLPQPDHSHYTCESHRSCFLSGGEKMKRGDSWYSVKTLTYFCFVCFSLNRKGSWSPCGKTNI